VLSQIVKLYVDATAEVDRKAALAERMGHRQQRGTTGASNASVRDSIATPVNAAVRDELAARLKLIASEPARESPDERMERQVAKPASMKKCEREVEDQNVKQREEGGEQRIPVGVRAQEVEHSPRTRHQGTRVPVAHNQGSLLLQGRQGPSGGPSPPLMDKVSCREDSAVRNNLSGSGARNPVLDRMAVERARADGRGNEAARPRGFAPIMRAPKQRNSMGR